MARRSWHGGRVFARRRGCFSLLLSKKIPAQSCGNSRALPALLRVSWEGTRSQKPLARDPGEFWGGFTPIPQAFVLALLLGLRSCWHLG